MKKIKSFQHFLAMISVGIMVAATGVGAGDISMAAYAGAGLGVVVIWAILAGGVLKFTLNEGLARWHIATETTLLQGWIDYLPLWVSIYFAGYLILWAFLVAGTLISFCGMAFNELLPLPMSNQKSVAFYGAVHSVVAAGLVRWGGFRLVERLMRLLIAGMFIMAVGSAILVQPDWSEILFSLWLPRLPADWDAVLLVFALIGGVGGSLTILCYSYWLQEKKEFRFSIRQVRLDLGVAYFLTVIFSMSVLIVASEVEPESIKGFGLVVSISSQLEELFGVVGRYGFILGFWGAVFSSMLGVWNGVPYLFADFVNYFQQKRQGKMAFKEAITQSSYYQYFLYYLAFPPIILTLFERPYWIAVAYAISGAFFMPFLATLLLVMNNKKAWMGTLRNGWLANAALIASLLLFLALFGVEVFNRFIK